MRLPIRARAGVAAAIAAAALWWWWPDEARRIRARLAEIVEIVNTPAAGTLDAAARATRLAAFFAPDVVVQPGPDGAPIRGRDRLVALAARAPAGDYELELVDVSVTVAEDERSALARLTAKLTSSRGGDPWVDARELKVELRRDGSSGEWVIGRVAAVSPLERPR
jgi:ketosteroid isomerase-like protein